MDGDWTEIYLYVASKTYKRWEKGEIPADIVMDSISDYQMKELNRLKAWLYRQRITARMEKDRVERRQKREVAKTQQEAEQPALFRL